MTETNEKLKKNLKETQSVGLRGEDTTLLIDFQEQYGISKSKLSYFALSALKSRKKKKQFCYLPKMRLQIAVLAILIFWNDPKMWILLKKGNTQIIKNTYDNFWPSTTWHKRGPKTCPGNINTKEDHWPSQGLVAQKTTIDLPKEFNTNEDHRPAQGRFITQKRTIPLPQVSLTEKRTIDLPRDHWHKRGPQACPRISCLTPLYPKHGKFQI